ncbi:MAG: ABC transporter ATP-binding protein [Armatimonadota bacterium]
MISPIVEFQNLSYSIEGRLILENITFSVNRGEYLSIIGPNGAGKSTLIKCLDRINLGWTGNIKLDGKPLENYKQKEIARKIGYVPQADGRLYPFSVYEFILMGRYPYLSPFSSISNEDKQIVKDCMKSTQTEHIADRLMDTLSGGERQKVFIAAALAQGAEILLLDEPTTFLDYHHQVDVLNLLNEVNKNKNITVISVTHDINSAVRCSSMIVALKNGKIVFHDTPQELVKRKIPESIFETSFQYINQPYQGFPILVSGDIIE